MPGLYAGAIQEDQNIYRSGLDYMSLPWSDALAASMKDTFVHNPIPEIASYLDLQSAKHPALRSFFDDMAVGAASENGADPTPVRDAIAQRNTRDAANGADRFIDPHTLNQKYGQSLGLSFDQPMRSGAVDIMVRRRAEDIDMNARLDHAPDGLLFGGTRLLTSLAVGATDPLNVASAFIPVVGETRYGMWAERYGKTLARFGQGAVEGAVGQAALEPINYLTENAYQNQYGPMDSFLNVAFGTILGGGLHTGFGALSDLLGRMAPETREQTLRAAVAQMAEGRDVEIDHIIASDPTFRQLDQMPVLRDLPLASEQARIEAAHASLTDHISTIPPGDPAARERLDRLDVVEHELRDPDITPEQRRELMNRRDEILTDTNHENLQAAAKPIEDRRNAENSLSSLSADLAAVKTKRLELQLQDALTPPAIKLASERAATRFRDNLKTGGEPVARQQVSGGLAGEVDRGVNEGIDRARTNTLNAAKGEGSQITGMKPGKTAEAVKAGQGDDLEAELQEATRRVDDFEKQGILTPEEAEKVRGTNAQALAATRSKAADAAAHCLLLHP